MVAARMALAGVTDDPVASHGIWAHARYVYCRTEAHLLGALVVSCVDVMNVLLAASVAEVGGRYARSTQE
jgi:hypothetical protein